jgi:hypothetical protein
MTSNTKEFDAQRNLPKQRISSHQLCKLNGVGVRRGYKGKVFVSHIPIDRGHDPFLCKNRNLDLVMQ